MKFIFSPAYIFIFVLLSSPLFFSTIIWERNNKAVCQALNCNDLAIYQSNRSVLCSYDKGVHIPDISDPEGCVTAAFPTFNKLFSPAEFIQKVGMNGVLAFVGDSLVRNLFTDTLDFLGPEYSFWYHDIVNKSATWKGAHREKIDHTYLCSPLLGPYNISIAFFWRPYIGATVVTRIPWVKDHGRLSRCIWWENGNAMRHCDASHEDGATERWQGEDRLDQVQFVSTVNEPPKPKRQFIVISSGGAHNIMTHLDGKLDFGNPDVYLNISGPPMTNSITEMLNTRQFWSIAEYGARNIMILPLRLQPGTRYSPVPKMTALERSLEEFVRKPLRGKSLLACEGDFEIIDPVNVTGSAATSVEPGTVGDGIHYTTIVNLALIQYIAERIILYNSSNWRKSSSWDAVRNYPTNEC